MVLFYYLVRNRASGRGNHSRSDKSLWTRLLIKRSPADERWRELEWGVAAGADICLSEPGHCSFIGRMKEDRGKRWHGTAKQRTSSTAKGEKTSRGSCKQSGRKKKQSCTTKTSKEAKPHSQQMKRNLQERVKQNRSCCVGKEEWKWKLKGGLRSS